MNDPFVDFQRAELSTDSGAWRFSTLIDPNVHSEVLAKIILLPVQLSDLGTVKAGRIAGLVGFVLGLAIMIPPALFVGSLFLIAYRISQSPLRATCRERILRADGLGDLSIRCGVASLAVAPMLAIALLCGIGPWPTTAAVSVLFAVALATSFLGRLAGMIAILLTQVYLAFFLMEPVFSFYIRSVADRALLVTVLLGAFAVIFPARRTGAGRAWPFRLKLDPSSTSHTIHRDR